MFRSFWRTVDRFSLEHFEHIIGELRGIKVVDKFNREVVVDILQSIVEIVSYGDKHDQSIFECFMEHQVLTEFIRILKTSGDSKIEATVLQYLNIMIQNLQSEQAIYYFFSNGYINSIITHEYEFHAGDLALYYVSFLRTVSGRLSRDTLCLLVKINKDTVTSFPLYTEAIRFAHHGEKMIQTAIRSLTLNIYNVSDDMVYRFLMAPPASEYLIDLFLKLREQCVHLDTAICSLRDNYTGDKRKDLLSGIEKLLDDLYYIKDLFSVGRSHLSSFLAQKLLGLVVVPIMTPLMKLGKTTGTKISAVTSLYILSRLLQVVDDKEILNSVASLVLYPHLASDAVSVTDTDFESCQIVPLSEHGNKIEQDSDPTLNSQESDKDEPSGHVLGNKLSACDFLSCQFDDSLERGGILSYIFSDSHGLLLASLMLLLVLAESDDLDNLLASVFGFTQSKSEGDDTTVSKLFKGSFLIQCMPQILNALLKILGNRSTSPALAQWHAGWFLLKFTNLQRATLNHQDLHLFNVSVRLNDSFHLARKCLLTELNGRWFDHIPDTFNKEWISCKKALEESSRNKDPCFILELAYHNSSSDGDGADAWEKMVDAVKIFVLHVLLKAYLVKGCLPDDPLRPLGRSSSTSLKNGHTLDASSTKFGSLVHLGPGVACKIAFSKLGMRDVYMIPVADGLSGKLLLVEKHPFHPQNGIVLAVAPLAGLTPKIDERHATWLHLHIRDFNPKNSGRKRSNLNTSTSNHDNVARWTLGFSDAEACEAARLLIHEETCKQRSFVESLLAPFLYDNYLNEDPDK